MAPRGNQVSFDRGGLAGVGIVALAVGCCAALPLLVGLVATLGAGTLFGVGAGIGVAAVALLAVVLRVRARRQAPTEVAR